MSPQYRHIETSLAGRTIPPEPTNTETEAFGGETVMTRRAAAFAVVTVLGLALVGLALSSAVPQPSNDFLGDAEQNAQQLVTQGRQIFRFDSFGDETFWTSQLGLNRVVASVSPRQALALG